MKLPGMESLLQLWDRVRTSLWFIPGLITLTAGFLAVLTPFLDQAIPDRWLERIPLVFSGEPEGARQVLTTIATAMITTAGVIFSMTIVTLQLASTQFGPRLLRTFLRDRSTQIVLGSFLASFLYCILVLPNVDGGAESRFVPHLAVSFAVVSAIVCLGMLVYYIDHLAQSIHADAVINVVGQEIRAVIDQLYPAIDDAHDDEGSASSVESDIPSVVEEITASTCGYLRYVNGESIVDCASNHGLVVELQRHPGDFIADGECVMVIRADRPLREFSDPELIRKTLVGAFSVGSNRTSLQDVGFACSQLTEMAVRALSPGINDPITAGHCIDRLCAEFGHLLERALPPTEHRDADGRVRLVFPSPPIAALLTATFEPIIRNAAHHLELWLSLIRGFAKIHDRAVRDLDRSLLRSTADQTMAAANRRFDEDAPALAQLAAADWTSET